jgi:hypothetical protein
MRSKIRLVIGSVFAALGVAGIVAIGIPAFAAGGTTAASATVNSVLSVTGQTASFSLPAGNPGATVTLPSALSFNIQTNSATGWSAKLLAASANMTGTGTNTATIPSTALTYTTTINGTAYPCAPGPCDTTAVPFATRAGGVVTVDVSGNSEIANGLNPTPTAGWNVVQGYSLALPSVPGDVYSVNLTLAVLAR